jgi:hypothetical protein
MKSERRGPLGRLLAAEQRFYTWMPGKDIYSKLLFRSLLWFTLFSATYTLIINL